MDARTLRDKLGTKAIVERLGVSKQSVSDAVSAGSFPAMWYEQLSALAKERGESCPINLFNMKPAANQPVERAG
ncbi:MAG: hypothetical protein AAGF20_07550 [Pseudomonadota bacterium]